MFEGNKRAIGKNLETNRKKEKKPVFTKRGHKKGTFKNLPFPSLMKLGRVRSGCVHVRDFFFSSFFSCFGITVLKLLVRDKLESASE
jgi:hypothetical protein